MRPAAILPLLLCALLPARALAADEGEDVVGAVPWRADADTVFLRRIVEAATGRPVAGATVKLFCEVPHPEPGFGTPAAVGESGADGWVRIARGALDDTVTATYGPPTWAYVEAPGLRPDAAFQGERRRLAGEPETPGAFTRSDPDWPLGPATTLRVALRDPLGAPVTGALVGWLLGCGHTPDVRQATTGSDGVAVLERVGASPGYGQVWPLAQGLRHPMGYATDDAWSPVERPRLAELDWAMTVEGTVLAHDGTPAAGVAVGYPNTHRGPWTRTDAQGGFRLVGSEVGIGDDIVLEAGEYPVGTPSAPRAGLLTRLTFPAPPPGHRVTIRLPAAGAQPEDERRDVRLVVEVDRTGWPETSARAGILVCAVRVADGWTETACVGEQGVALLDVRPGAYVVEAMGSRECSGGGLVHARSRAEVRVPDTGGAYVRLALPPPIVQPLEIAWPDASPFLDEVALVANGATTTIFHDSDEGAAVEVLLPSAEPVHLRVRQGDRVRLTRLETARVAPGARAPTVRVEPFAPVVLRARLVDAEGKPVMGRLSELASSDRAWAESPPKGAASTTPTLSTLAGDGLTLIAWPEDDARFQPRFVDVPRATTHADMPVDLGPIVLPTRAPVLRLVDADGKPSEGATLLVSRADRSASLATDVGARAGQAFDPWHAPGLLVEGATVRVLAWDDDGTAPSASHALPYVRTLEGPGPWTIRPPTGALSIVPQREGGAPIEGFAVFLDERRFQTATDRIELHRLEAGTHEVVLDVPGAIPRRLVFTLDAGTTRAWAPTLRVATPR